MAHFKNHAALKEQGHRDHSSKVHKLSGRHSDVTRDDAKIKSAVAQHEAHDHKDSPLTKLKLSKGGGATKGGMGKARLDKHGSSRRALATGGAAKPKKSGKSGNHVNVIVAPGGGGHPPMGGAPMAGGPPMGAKPPMPPSPPQSAPIAGLGGPPGGGPMGPKPPMGPPVGAGMRNHGGRTGKAGGGSVSSDYEGGAGGAMGRMEKIKKYGTKKLGTENKPEAEDEENKANTFNADTQPKGRKSGGRAMDCE